MSAQEKRLIIGMGDSGLSMAAYWRGAAELTVVDDRPHPPKHTELQRTLPEVHCRCGEDFRGWGAECFVAYALVGLSPGIPPAEVAADMAHLTNDADCFSGAWQREAPAQSCLLAVTGSNGKSTVTALVAHLIRSSGRTVEAVGNIGKPMLDALREWRQRGFPQAVVVELSSFQLELAREFYSDAAAVLNVGGDHLDRHGSIQHTTAIKGNIYNRTRRAIINADASLYPQRAAAVSYSETRAKAAADAADADADWTLGDGWIHRAGARYCEVAALSDTCRHYPSLVLAALALTDFMQLPQESVVGALASFVGLPHRRRVIARRDGITYIDDSKATNVESALYAVRGVGADGAGGKVVWIGGGDGKGQDFSPLRDMAGQLRAAILIGRDAAAIEAVLGAAGVHCTHAADMPAAVCAARALAQRGDTVLLSPACSSLDMFADYRARGQAFARAAKSVAVKEAAQKSAQETAQGGAR